MLPLDLAAKIAGVSQGLPFSGRNNEPHTKNNTETNKFICIILLVSLRRLLFGRISSHRQDSFPDVCVKIVADCAMLFFGSQTHMCPWMNSFVAGIVYLL